MLQAHDNTPQVFKLTVQQILLKCVRLNVLFVINMYGIWYISTGFFKTFFMNVYNHKFALLKKLLGIKEAIVFNKS